jgi:hypothetical protein
LEISSHYYALLALCRTCGIDKKTSEKIAYASQYVDDGKVNCVETKNGLKIKNVSSCHSYSKVRTFNYQAMIYNTSAFHFFPSFCGDEFTERLLCKENNTHLKELIKSSLDCEPERLGMLMHIYADTFSHQGFSGLLSKQNDIEELKAYNMMWFQNGFWSSVGDSILSGIKSVPKFFKSKHKLDIEDFMPAYGHGQAMHHPDIPYLKWSYKLSTDRCDKLGDRGIPAEKIESDGTINVDNSVRFKSAFMNIKEVLLEYLVQKPQYKEKSVDNLDEFYKILTARARDSKKISMWRDYLVRNNYYDIKSKELFYDEEMWLRSVIKDYDNLDKDAHTKRKLIGVEFIDDYEKTSWYKFATSVEWYKKELIKICEQNGVILNQ